MKAAPKTSAYVSGSGLWWILTFALHHSPVVEGSSFTFSTILLHPEFTDDSVKSIPSTVFAKSSVSLAAVQLQQRLSFTSFLLKNK